MSGGAAVRSGAVLALLAVVAPISLPACKKTVPPVPDAGPVGNCTAAPCMLASGVAATGTIEAVGQSNLYSIELPASAAGKRTLVKIQLASPAPASPVRLVFFLETPDGNTTLATRGPVAGTGAQALAGNFLLPGPGVYRLLVRDGLATHVDARNPYTLTATLLDDPDAAEPDDLPAQARALVPGAFGQPLATASGIVASAGDRDLRWFDLAAPALVRMTVQQASAGGPLRLRYRLLSRSAAAPDDFGSATAVIDGQAASAGAALAVDQIRYLDAGRYLVALEDASGRESDERPAAAWAVGLGLVPDPDPNEQITRNDTAATATPLALGETKEGAIGSVGDVDWFEVQLPATTVPQLLELKLDPQLSNNSVELNWAVGTVVPAPSIPCGFQCPVSAFCAPTLADGGSPLCVYTAHAVHHFVHGETTVQVIRLRHFGPAETVRIVLDDQNGDERTTDPYKLSAALLPEPDVHENTAATPSNDDRSTSSVLAPALGAAGEFTAASWGRISWWDYIDGKTVAELPADVDWYELDLPPRTLAPACPVPPDAGTPDAGTPDAGPPNRLPDGGVCGPDPLDGGPVWLPRPDYGLIMTWNGPADRTYRIGFQGWLATDADGGAGCVFAFNEKFARDAGGGAFAFGDAPFPGQVTGPCLCLDSQHAERDRLWVRVDSAAYRPEPPPAAGALGNAYTDQPYSFSLDFRPGPTGLASFCDGGCSNKTASSCF